MNSVKERLFVAGSILVMWCSQVSAANLPFGEPQTGTIGSPAETNTYTFSASASDVVEFTIVTTSGNLFPRIRLYNSAGTLISEAYRANVFGCIPTYALELNTVTIPVAGTYTLLVGDCSNANTGNYLLYAQRTSNPTGAAALVFGGSVQSGNIGLASQSNTYKFNAYANDLVNFTMTTTGGSLNPKIRLYNTDGKLLSQLIFANINGCIPNATVELNNSKLPATGTYTVLVGDCGDTNTGAYNLSARCFGICGNDPPGAGQLPRSGVLSHIAAGGSWSTVITLTNTSSVAVPVAVAFRNDDGAELSLPVTTINRGATQTTTAASVSATINPNSTLLISTGPMATTVVGWAEVSSSVPIQGFAIFRTNSTNSPVSEGTVPLQTQFPSILTLPYDNAEGFVMGAAVVNLSQAPATITATIWDDRGTQLGTQTIRIAANGHTSFVLPDQIPFTAGKRGFVQLQSGASGGLAGLGLRFSPFGTFTSVPVM